MFKTIDATGEILFLDDIDSLLRMRGINTPTWEMSASNELLVAIEQFDGVVVVATNHMDQLDDAAFRRFDFKIHFDYLTLEQYVHAVNTICDTQQSGLSEDIQEQLKQMDAVTIAD